MVADFVFFGTKATPFSYTAKKKNLTISGESFIFLFLDSVSVIKSFTFQSKLELCRLVTSEVNSMSHNLKFSKISISYLNDECHLLQIYLLHIIFLQT